MRIGIDARVLSLPATHKTGIARWNQNLLQGLAAIDKTNEYLLLCRMFESDRVEQYGENFSKVELEEYEQLDAAGQGLEQLRVGRTLNQLGIDLYYSPYYLLPLERQFPAVCLFDDLIPWIIMKKWSHIIPSSHRVGADMQEIQVWKRISAMSADGIVSISECTRKDLGAMWNIDLSKIRTIYSGIEPAFCKIQDEEKIERFRNECGLPQQYILYVGTLEPRKNIEGIIRAYALLRKKHGVEIPIVFAGQKGQSFQTIFTKTLERELGGKYFSQTNGHGFNDIYVRTRYFSRDEQVLLYNGASLLVWPSFYEGFGLPVLEGMACGLPVITSNTSSLPEVGGDAAIYVDPDNHEDIACKIARILGDSEFRKLLQKKSLQQAAKFSLKQCSEEFLEFISSVAGSADKSQKRANMSVIERHNQCSEGRLSNEAEAVQDPSSYEASLRAAMPSIYKKIASWKNPKKILVHGAGYLGSYVVQHINRDTFTILGFMDSDTNKIGKRMGSYEIYSIQEGLAAGPDVIWIASKEYRDEIVNDLVAAGWSEDRILPLF